MTSLPANPPANPPASAGAGSAPTGLASPSIPSTQSAQPSAAGGEQERLFALQGWKTDFTRKSIDLREILSGGPPRDGIPPIDRPQFESIEAARGWLGDFTPVIALEIGGEARAYPIAILIWHEIANDVVGGKPVAVTFCPLCNTAIVFDRTLNGQVYDFGTTGNLRRSDLVMYDRQTETWWQQVGGEAIVGSLTGSQLTFIPAQMISLYDFSVRYPEGTVLSRDTGFARQYGFNPYPGYDEAGLPPFLFEGVVDGRLSPKERVVAVKIGAEAWAFRYVELRRVHFAEAVVGGTPIAVFWWPGAMSPLNAEDIKGRNIGATGVFDRRLGGRTLTFRNDPGGPAMDIETGSRWSLTGRATSGPLVGQQLVPIVHTDPFWFAWAAFEPSTTIWAAP